MTEYRKGRPFCVEDEVGGRIVVEVIDLPLGLEHTKYRVRYRKD